MLLSFIFGLSSLYGLVVLLIKLRPKIILEGLFLNRICPPKKYLHLDEPEVKYGLKGAKCIRLDSSSQNSIGVWHIPPKQSPQQSLHDASRLVVYCHGNAFHRGFGHRVELYKKFISSGFHVVTFDYSGYGDSSGQPSVSNAVEDASFVYRWSVNQVNNKECVTVLWGHSLGTHMSTRALLRVSEDGCTMPDCLVLEAPFTTAIEASECFPLSKAFFKVYPYLKSGMKDTLKRYKSECSTVDILPSIQVPILILHAEDDTRVDFNLGMKLYKKTISSPSRKSQFIRFVQINGRHGVQHYTARHPDTETLLEDFLTKIQDLANSTDLKHELLQI